MDKIERLEADLVDMKLELRTLHVLPKQIDDLIESQKETNNAIRDLISHLNNNFISEKMCIEKRNSTDKLINALEGKVNKALLMAVSAMLTALGYLLTLVVHK